MKNLLLALLTIVLFMGCTPPSAFNHFEKSEFFKKAVQYTQKRDITKGEDVVLLFHATYLNKVDARYDDDFHNFLVSVYTNDSSQQSKYYLHLHSQVATSITMLQKDNPLLQKTPMANLWSNYYIYSFAKQKQTDTLSLQLHHAKYQNTAIEFSLR